MTCETVINEEVNPFSKGLCHLVINSKNFPNFQGSSVYLCQNGGIPSEGGYRVFVTDPLTKYLPFCDDFGPMNILSIMQFVESLDKEVVVDVESSVVFRARNSCRDFTNAAFLLGAYMILRLDLNVQVVVDCFSALDGSLFEGYRDATFSKADFRLTLVECWNGLQRSVDLGWLALPSSRCRGWDRWGRIYRDEFAHFDNPRNGELHEVIPGKIVALKGPKDLGGHRSIIRKDNGLREFSAEYYVDIFRLMGVTTVVQLNSAKYDATSFNSHGIAHFELPFEDNVPPPSSVIAQFLKIVDESRGLIAVHCGAGLGRTGTLIALYLMRTHGFTALEAIAWLRIMRPGSVIGQQQHFLCTIEKAVRSLQEQQAPTQAPAQAQQDRPPQAFAALAHCDLQSPAASKTAAAEFRGVSGCLKTATRGQTDAAAAEPRRQRRVSIEGAGTPTEAAAATQPADTQQQPPRREPSAGASAVRLGATKRSFVKVQARRGAFN